MTRIITGLDKVRYRERPIRYSQDDTIDSWMYAKLGGRTIEPLPRIGDKAGDPEWPFPSKPEQYLTDDPKYVMQKGDLVVFHIPRPLTVGRTNPDVFVMHRVDEHYAGATLGNRKNGNVYMVPGWAKGWLISRADPEEDA